MKRTAQMKKSMIQYYRDNLREEMARRTSTENLINKLKEEQEESAIPRSGTDEILKALQDLRVEAENLLDHMDTKAKYL